MTNFLTNKHWDEIFKVWVPETESYVNIPVKWVYPDGEEPEPYPLLKTKLERRVMVLFERTVRACRAVYDEHPDISDEDLSRIHDVALEFWNRADEAGNAVIKERDLPALDRFKRRLKDLEEVYRREFNVIYGG